MKPLPTIVGGTVLQLDSSGTTYFSYNGQAGGIAGSAVDTRGVQSGGSVVGGFAGDDPQVQIVLGIGAIQSPTG